MLEKVETGAKRGLHLGTAIRRDGPDVFPGGIDFGGSCGNPSWTEEWNPRRTVERVPIAKGDDLESVGGAEHRETALQPELGAVDARPLH